DVFYVNWDEVLPGATAVISTLGGFGSEEQMQRINGEANIIAVNAAKEYGIPNRGSLQIPEFWCGAKAWIYIWKKKASDLILAPPVSVDDVALAAINAVKDDDCFGVFTIHQIKEAAAGVKV
nr:hypothetical protein [Tanacetum cinerariifolium]